MQVSCKACIPFNDQVGMYECQLFQVEKWKANVRFGWILNLLIFRTKENMLVFSPYCFLRKIPSENMHFSLNE